MRAKLSKVLSTAKTAQEIFLINAGATGLINISSLERLKSDPADGLIIVGWIPPDMLMSLSENNKASILIVNKTDESDDTVYLSGEVTGIKELAALDDLAANEEDGTPQVEDELRVHIDEIRAVSKRFS